MSTAIHGHAEAASAFSRREMRMDACGRGNAPTVFPTIGRESEVILSGKTMANDTDDQIRNMLRRSGWPTAPAAAPADAVGRPAPQKPRRGIFRRPGTLGGVPPYCFAPAGASPEEAAVAAANALSIPQDDTLGRWVLLLQFQRAAKTAKGK